MRKYPSPFHKGTKYEEAKDDPELYKFPGYWFLSHQRLPSTKYAKDLLVELGAPILAVEDGTVISVKNDSDKFINPITHPRYEVLFRENNLSIEELEVLKEELLELSEKYTNHVQVNQVDDSVAQYFHLDKNTRVTVKQKIRQGDVLGAVGLNGLTTGPHLHINFAEILSVPFEISEID